MSVDEILEDAKRRKEIISTALNTVIVENDEVVAQNDSCIEQKKIEIGELEKDNAERHQFVEEIKQNSEKEFDRICNLVDFIRGDEA